jgi:hypothetical protein
LRLALINLHMAVSEIRDSKDPSKLSSRTIVVQ